MRKRETDRQSVDWVPLALFALTFLSRIPFRSQILYHWDSVNFANAMREFDVIREHPQPPGYIVYVWLSRAVDVLFRDAQVTMVWISVAASALTVMALYYLGRPMWGRRVGVVAALLMATSPLFWFYGEIALPHALDTFLVILSAWWLYEVAQGNTGYLFPVIVVLGIAGGVRQQTLVFLMPVALFAMRKVGFKRLLVAGGVGAAVCLVWFVPLMASSGGIDAYLEKTGEFAARFQVNTSVLMGAGWSGVAYNARKLAMYTLYGWCAGLVPAVGGLAVRLRYRQRPKSWERFWFIVLWIGPSLGFYTLIHMGQQGLVFVFLPALLLISAAGLVRALDRWGKEQWWGAAAAALVLANAAIFCLVPEYPLGPGTQRLLTRATIANNDRYFQDRFATIEAHFQPESTAILTLSPEHLAYYLPAYPRLPISVVGPGFEEDAVSSAELDFMAERVFRPEAAYDVVIFDPQLEPLNQMPERARAVALQHGGTLKVVPLGSDEDFFYGLEGFGAR